MASSTSDLDHSQRSLNEAIAEYYREIELGSGFDRSAFVAKYPGLATQIKAFLLTVLEFEHDLKAAQSQPIHSLTTLGRGRARDGLETDCSRIDFALIYVAGICLVSFCMISMIQRVRSLTDYHQN